MYTNQISVDRKRFVDPNPLCHKSSNCKIYFDDALESTLAERYGRNGLCLKVFSKPPNLVDLDGYGWRKILLSEATIIQNIFALNGLSPRVYDIVLINEESIAQVTEFVYSYKRDKPRIEEVQKLVKDLKIVHSVNQLINNRVNAVAECWVGKWFVDFGGFKFEGKDEYMNDLRQRAHMRRGIFRGAAYQSVPALEIKGSRNSLTRAWALGLNEIDFGGKTVLDIGCDLGETSRILSDFGAQRVVGVDRRDKPQLAYEISNLLGRRNMDFIRAPLPDHVEDIRKVTGIEQFDIVLFLSVIDHVSYGKWCVDLVKDGGLFFVEGHGQRDLKSYVSELLKILKKDFAKVEFLDFTRDNYIRPIFRCVK